MSATSLLLPFARRFQSQVLGACLLFALIIAGNSEVEGFTSSFNIKSMLVLASFLGVAAIGQTICALIGGLDISIPFVIGAANLVMVWLIGKGLSAPMAILVVLALALVVGILNGLISYHVGAPSLIVTLGMGFAVLGLAQIVATSSSEFAGVAVPPVWLTEMTSLNGSTLGVGIPSVAVVWVVLSLAFLAFLRLSSFGRGIYALGSNPIAAKRALVPEQRTWVTVFALSALMAGVAGILLVGFSGGGQATIGEPYLFTTVAAVVIGGTSLLGGRGGYGLTMLGVAILTVLQSLLSGVGLSPPGQQAVLGGLIILMLAFYAREPHARMQV